MIAHHKSYLLNTPGSLATFTNLPAMVVAFIVVSLYSHFMPKLLPENLIENVAERFRVLGDATRLAILHLLLERGELNVGEICSALDASQANVSKHLRTLHDAGMVTRRPVGTAAYYTVTDPTIIKLCDIVCDRLKRQAADEARAFAIA